MNMQYTSVAAANIAARFGSNRRASTGNSCCRAGTTTPVLYSAGANAGQTLRDT